VEAELERRSEEEWRRQIEALTRETNRLVSSGMPKEVAEEEAFASLAHPQITAQLAPGESIRQAGNAGYEAMPEDYSLAHVAVTNRHVVWSVLPRFELVLSLSYSDVVAVGWKLYESASPDDLGGKAIRITYRPADFPAELRRINPTGELDAAFFFPDRSEAVKLQMGILARTGHPGPHDDGERQYAVERLRSLSTDVTSWGDLCPMCLNDLVQKTASSVRCQGSHLFSNPDVEPVIDESENHFGEIIDETRWMPVLLDDRKFVGKPLIWLTWKDRPFGPPKILDYETITAAWVEV
jgi:hypothetical protein